MRTLTIQVLLILFLCVAAFGQTPVKRVDPAVKALGGDFAAYTIEANGTRLHYVKGGAGAPVILIHGFPQDWYEFHKLMPRLAKKFTVIAIDLRGIGGSGATEKGYDAANLAEDVNQLIHLLKLEKPYLAGHDIGGMVTYAFARLYPQTARGVMMLEVPLPGLEPWNEVKNSLWHVGFNQTPDLPEQLVAGRQKTYLKYFFQIGTMNHEVITEADVAHYVNSYSSPAQLRAGFEFYRALPANEEFNARQSRELDLPLTLVGGDNSFGRIMPRLVEDLRKHGCQNVTLEIMKNSRHYVADEQPEAVAELIERYASMK